MTSCQPHEPANMADALAGPFGSKDSTCDMQSGRESGRTHSSPPGTTLQMLLIHYACFERNYEAIKLLVEAGGAGQLLVKAAVSHAFHSFCADSAGI